MDGDLLARRTAAAAHEINNVASVVRLLADTLLADESLPARVRSTVGAMRDAADRGAGLAWSLLDLVHHRPPVPRRVDLDGIVRDLALELHGDPPITVSTGGTPALVDADPAQLRELLLALVTNAREAGASLVRVAVAGRTVTVADDGHGIAPDLLPHVCAPYVTTKPGEGRGLGLAYAARIADDHGGRLDVAGAPSGGTVVTVTLPVPAGEGDGDVPGLVLVVDDDEHVRTALVELLASLGLPAIAADDGAAALDLHAAHAGSIGLVISDVTMADVDGLALHRTLAARDPGLRVVLTSGWPRPPEVGDDVAWLRKPFSREQLAAVAAAVR